MAHHYSVGGVAFVRPFSKPIASLFALAASLPAASNAVAQDAIADDVAQAQSGQQNSVETIVVTARRRDENLQDTPVSISAFSGQALEARQVQSVADVGNFAPNVSLSAGANLSGSSASLTAFIRGIGQTDFNLTIDPGVGMYVDGVYVSRSVGALLDLIDVNSVQILRGPQGTLFGKNTIGGAIVVTSKLPSERLEGMVEVATGRFDRFDVRGMLNMPVSDSLRIRASGALSTRDGYVHRLADGGSMGNENSLAGRLVAEFEPSPKLKFTLSIDGNRRREEGKPVVLLGVDEGILPPGSPNSGGQFSFFYNKALMAPACGAVGAPSPINNPLCFNSQWITGDRDSTWASGPNSSRLDLWGSSLTSEWELPFMAVKSITAYRHLHSVFYMDNDATPLPIGATGNDYVQSQFSQEMQLSGKSLDNSLNWVAGLYYLNETGTDRNSLSFAIADFLSGGSVNNDSYAGFAQLSYEVTSKFSLTLGGRYTHEIKRFVPDQFIISDRTGGSLLMLSRCFISNPPTIPPNPGCTADPSLNPDGNRILPNVEVSTTANEFKLAVTADYHLTDDVLVYATYAQGFKSGGFTQRVFPPEPVTPSFEPEYVDNYEAGFKSELFDRRLRLNGAAFQTDYSNLQIIVNEGIAPKVRNAAKARIRGFELETELVPVKWLKLSGALGYTDAHYLEVPTSAAPVTVDSQLPNAPKWTANAGASVDLFDNDSGHLSARGDWSYMSGHYLDAANSFYLYQPKAGVINASATYRTANKTWAITAGVTNVTNSRKLLSGYQDLENTSTAIGSYSRPREWFVQTRYTF